MIKIAVDAMGSDEGSKIVVEAIKQYHQTYPEVVFYVCGKKDELQELKDFATVVEANDIMGMEDGALEVIRRKETSMLKAVDLVANGMCQGVVGAGSTAAFLTAATLKLKLIPGVQRAALTTPFPTLDGKGVVLLDVGANNENTPTQLVQFAKMGLAYAKFVRKVVEPNLYLLSNGTEEKKGSPVVKEAHQLLKELHLPNFKGNIEAREVLSGEADVVVCGGFEGNVLLKSTEGTAAMMNNLLKKAFKTNLCSKIGYLFAKGGMKGMRETLDYRKYGGAMLIGVNGVVVKGHGNSNSYAFYNAIRVTHEMIESGIVGKLKEEMASE